MSFKKFIANAIKVLDDKSPEILLGGAIVSFGATVFFACKATTKVEEIISEHEERIGEVNKLIAKKVSDDPEYRDDDYTEKDAKRDKFIITTQTGVKLLKDYAPAIIFAGCTIFCMLGSYNILHKRYVAASTLAASLFETLSKYRKRVVEEYGEDVDKHLYYGTKYAEIVETDEKGKEKKISAEIFDDVTGIPVYAKFFDESCRAWTKDPTIKLTYLRGVQARANDIFHDRGYLMLNQVYSMLGIPETDVSCQVGWFEKHGDKFVDFGLYNGAEERVRAFINGYEPSILLNFNCVPKFAGDLAQY